MIARQIKLLRAERKLTQEKLARLAGISYNTLSKIENSATMNPTMRVLAGIARALHVPVDRLMED